MALQHTIRAALLAGVVMALAAPAVFAQDGPVDEPAAKKHVKEAPLFPMATRREPGLGVSNDMDKPITKLLALVNTHANYDEAIAAGQKIAADTASNKYDRAVAYQAVAYAYLNKGDHAQGVVYLQKAIAENSLSNNEHYQMMLQVSRSQIAAGQTAAGLATLDKVIAETKQDKPEYDVIRGRVYFQQKDYAKAVQALEKSQQGATQVDPQAQQMLFASYIELKQPERATKIAEDLAHAHPDDKIAAMNLAGVYQQAGQPEKAAAQLEDARKRGLMTTPEDYRRLYVLYSNMKGREGDSISTINDGLQKGILQPNAEVYTTLAEDYYFTNQHPQAIEAYKKADAASTNGEAALNLAKMYNNEGRAADAKAMAEKALQKGVKKPEEAKALIQRTGAVLKNPTKKK